MPETSNPACCLTVSLWLRPGAEEAAAVHLHALALNSRQEPGCLVYNVHRPAGEPRRIFIYELYRDEGALEAHRRTPHFAEHATLGLYPLVERREAETYAAVNAMG